MSALSSWFQNRAIQQTLEIQGHAMMVCQRLTLSYVNLFLFSKLFCIQFVEINVLLCLAGGTQNVRFAMFFLKTMLSKMTGHKSSVKEALRVLEVFFFTSEILWFSSVLIALRSLEHENVKTQQPLPRASCAQHPPRAASPAAVIITQRLQWAESRSSPRPLKYSPQDIAVGNQEGCSEFRHVYLLIIMNSRCRINHFKIRSFVFTWLSTVKLFFIVNYVVIKIG